MRYLSEILIMNAFLFIDQHANHQNDRDARRIDERLVLAMSEENGRFTSLLFGRREAP